MRRQLTPRAVWLALVMAAISAGLFACGDRREPNPIRLAANQMTVENRTPQEWLSVEVWVNDHYRVTKSSMGPGEQFTIPLGAFVAGFGQRFDPKRQVVQGVEVTATTRSGPPVKLVYGRGRRR